MTPHSLRQYADTATSDAREYRQKALEATGWWRDYYLRRAESRQSDAEFYRMKADRDEQWFAEQVDNFEQLEAAE